MDVAVNKGNVLIRVTTKHGRACYGLVVKDGIVIESAPIARWATGKAATEVIALLRLQGAKLQFKRLDG